jgi:pyridoxine 4-dehydrogenase
VTARHCDPGAAALAGVRSIGEDLIVRRMAFGAMNVLARGSEAAGTLLQRALELGVNLLDTADVYGAGTSEEAIADAIHPYPSDLVIATKGGQVVVGGRAHPNGRSEHLRAACEASLGRLRVDCIDLYQFHSPDPETPIEESLGTLSELREEGKLRHIGLSNFYGADLEAAVSCASIVSVQNRYNVAGRRADPEVSYCESNGLAFIAYSPLGAGALTAAGGEIGRIAAARGATPAQITLAWLLHRSPAIVPIPGTSSLDHLEENVFAAALQLSEDELGSLESASGEPV